MDAIETIKENVSPVAFSVIHISNDYDIDGSGEDYHRCSDKDHLIEEDER